MSFRSFAASVLLITSIAQAGAALGLRGNKYEEPKRAEPVSVGEQTTPPKINVKLVLAGQRAQRGRAVSASLIIEIPSGYHVNAHDPVSRFALPTKVGVEVPGGIKVGPITYPKAIVRKFSFSGDRLGVYENRTMIKFVIMVPPNQPRGNAEIKARLNYQSCSDEVCFPPTEREVAASLTIS